MTDDTPATDTSESTDSRETMRSVQHTHPQTNATFGAVFRRGPVVAADGGERDGEEADEAMEDIDHEAPGEGVNRTYERGTEGRNETV